MILYKYYPLNEHSIKSLAIGGLWCRYPSQMNDPLECLAGSPIDFDANNTNHDPQAWGPLIGRMRQEFIERFCFCSLAEVPDHPLMWSHYANGHRGCAIGIEFDGDLNGHLHPVTYSDKQVYFPLGAVSALLASRDAEDGDCVRKILKSLSVKAKYWSYEQEWRIWRRSPGYHKYDIANVRGIYFGDRCPPELQMIVLKLLDDFPENFVYKQLELKFDPIRLEY